MTDELREQIDRIIDQLTAMSAPTQLADDLLYQATELLRQARDGS